MNGGEAYNIAYKLLHCIKHVYCIKHILESCRQEIEHLIVVLCRIKSQNDYIQTTSFDMAAKSCHGLSTMNPNARSSDFINGCMIWVVSNQLRCWDDKGSINFHEFEATLSATDKEQYPLSEYVFCSVKYFTKGRRAKACVTRRRMLASL